MFQALILFIVLLMMFFSKRGTKLIILFGALLCMDLFSLGYGEFTKSPTIIMIAYLISDWDHIRSNIANFKRYKIFFPIVIMLIPTIVLAINSPHYSGAGGFFKIFMYEIITKYLILWIGFSVISARTDFNKLYKWIFYGLLILTIFGLINYILKTTPWSGFFNGRGAGKFSLAARFRTNALFASPFVYGFMCTMILIFSYYGHYKKLITSTRAYIIYAMCLFGIIACGCRTILATLVLFSIGAIIALPKIGKIVKYYLISISLFAIAYFFIPAVSERVDFFLTAFDPESEMEGSSSMNMREMQLESVLSYIQSSPIFGRGFRFFYYDLGWENMKTTGAADASLHGIEGVHLIYLLERGFFGYLFYLFFYGFIIYTFYRYKVDRFSAVLSILVIVIYLAFSHMTGELGTAPIALFFTGLLYKLSIENISTNRQNESQVQDNHVR